MPTNGTYALRTGTRMRALEAIHPSVRAKERFFQRIAEPDRLPALLIPALPAPRIRSKPRQEPTKEEKLPRIEVPDQPLAAPDATLAVVSAMPVEASSVTIGLGVFLPIALGMILLSDCVAHVVDRIMERFGI